MLNKNCFDAKSDAADFPVKNANYGDFGQALIIQNFEKKIYKVVNSEILT